MRVTGELTPDIRADFTRADDYDDEKCWIDTGTDWAIWWDAIPGFYVISEGIGAGIGGEDDYWIRHDGGNVPTGIYDAGGTAAGEATVTSIS